MILIKSQVQSNDYQYWGEISIKNGVVEIPRVKEGVYRLTVSADGVFGDFIQEHITIRAGKTTSVKVKWEEETAGKELWRIGIPDKSAGEYKHGYELDETHPLHPEQYRIYWGAYDFPTDFPDGVLYKVGESNNSAFNYIHWSVFGGKIIHSALTSLFIILLILTGNKQCTQTSYVRFRIMKMSTTGRSSSI
jgi:rhamnogalacturonan endolyase